MLSVALIEDNDAHAELFTLHMSRIEGLDIDVSRFSSGTEAIRALSASEPDLIFVDYMLVGENGVDLIQTLRCIGVNVPIVAITSHSDAYLAARITRAGADEYLIKNDLSTESLVALLDRMLVIGRERAAKGDASRVHAEHLSTLTAREREVLEHIMAGKTNKQIAADLHRSIKTIKVHRGRVMEKMQANTPAELAKFVFCAEPDQH